MTHIKRRQFLQFASSALATVGISQLDIMRQSEQYAKVLAQNTPRKLALLVGIDEYKNNITPLAGCKNDVLLQRELLTHRFGFNDKDILTLTNAQATRQGILQAFEQHLIDQAKPGDVVVFHYSGHGSRVQDKDRDTPDGLNGTLVPFDSSLPPNGGVVQDIMGHTLFLLMYALKTENVTVVLDSCYSGATKRGNLVVRSRNGGSKFLPSPAEYEEQRKLLAKTGLSAQEFINKRKKNVAKGIVITAARRDQEALEARTSDFSSGAFTYALTQYLWQQIGDESFNKTFVNVRESTQEIIWNQEGAGERQIPEIEQNLPGNSNASIYHSTLKAVPAEAVVTDINGDEVNLWLGGIPSQSLEGFNEKAVFTVVDANGQGRGQVQISSRQGLTAKGKLVNTPRTQLQKGTLLQERIRTIPKDLTLKIGLDDTSLDSNTIKQAKQALQAINRIEALSLEQSEVHYIFGRMTQAKYQELQQKRISNLPAVGSFGLFSPTLDGIISSSFGNANEAVSSAVERLRPKLKSFLAARIVKDILGNTNTSKISITASMVVAGSQKLLAETFTTRSIKQNTGVVNSPKPTKPINFSNSGMAKLPVGISIAFQIQNNESVPLHVSILGIDSTGRMDVIFPYDRSEGATIIQPRQKLLIPQPPEPGEKPTTFDISEPLGFGEALIIASTEPLRGFIDIIKTLANTRGISDQRSPIPDITGDEFLDLTNSLLDDLDRSTRGGTGNENTQLPPDTRGSDATKLAVMSIPFEVIS
ncbi:caspase family protein [Scytonema hofmannii FACHB-248]|uniref:Caspase family protein n=1 Tax=Scytonema hofmannii FACHB-248 TaxID=1842502 RepID=A0ABR8GNH5_9CYAN|nr:MULTISPECIES: caspase family protein [Nostocales]MBD2604801.1 caspase family protein [Scytonema hofmannii FACHB-248]